MAAYALASPDATHRDLRLLFVVCDTSYRSVLFLSFNDTASKCFRRRNVTEAVVACKSGYGR